MKNMESKIKRIKHGLKISVATILLAASLTSCSNIKTTFATQEEVVNAAETLECDTSYLMTNNGNFIRMKHNNGEPIYVCFDDEYSDFHKEKAKEALDYVFGIVGKINDKYHYEIVDKSTFDSKLNKTKIFYTYGQHVTDHGTHQTIANGHAENYSPWYNQFIDNPVMNYYEVNLNPDIEYEKVLSTFIHEDLHLYGLNDVYTIEALKTTTKYYGNTYMNLNIDYEMITPNDLACLICLYADEDCDMIKMKSELQKYETKFYNYYTNKCKQQLKTTEDVVDENFIWFGGIVKNFEDGSSIGTDYRLSVENGYYTLQLMDSTTKKEVDSASGEATLQNGVLILKNVQLKKGLYLHNEEDCYEGGFIQDLAVLSKDGVISLYNPTNNDFLYGGYMSLEKGLTQ